MSGPTTVVIATSPVVALLAAAAIRATAAVMAAHSEAAGYRSDRANEDRNRARQGADAQATGTQETLEAIAAAEAGFERLQQIADQLGIGEAFAANRRTRPAAADLDSLSAHLRALESLNAELQSILQSEVARRQSAAVEDRAPAFLEALAAAVGSTPPGSETTAVERILARIAHLGPLPEALHALARTIELEPPGERRTLLMSELRLQVQQRLEADYQQQVDAAKALIVEQTLRDLGYQVEPIHDTLFVEGGVVHFRKPGWGDYMVRMRIGAAEGSANFNVVRGVAAGDNERSVLDHLAEDRWCAEFPALLKALEARGIHMQVTRRLDAGELPVQLVDRERLPQFNDAEDDRRAHGELMAREIR